MRLGVDDHDRSSAGLTYVYPVVSRRAGGVSVGINLNPNNACNWRCVYCQVPGLGLGPAPAIDLGLLERELGGFLGEVVRGDWLERSAPEGARRLSDVAFSGNGEPTSSPQLAEAIDVALAVRQRFALAKSVRLVLITNGSLVHQARVREGLELLAGHNAEIWFKLDSATDQGAQRINANAAGPARTRTNLRLAAGLVPTWVQTLAFAWNGRPPSEAEQEAYLEFLADEQRAGTPLSGVLLYGLARPSHQPEAPELAPLARGWLEDFAARVRALELEVRVFP